MNSIINAPHTFTCKNADASPYPFVPKLKRLYPYELYCEIMSSLNVFEIPSIANPAATPPSSCAITYPIKSTMLILFEISMPSETAGLIWHPEILPIE